MGDCRIEGDGGRGIPLRAGADASVSRSEIATGREGVLIKQGAAPLLSRNTIRENINAGVYVEDGGLGLIENNDILDDRESGVAIGNGGAPTVRNKRVHGNNGKGVWCADHAAGEVVENDLHGNAFGARHPMDGEHHPSQTVFRDNKG